jgi:hypothetical protein
MAICSQCGKPMKDDAKFCGVCGASRTVTPPPPEQTVTAPPPPLPPPPPPAPPEPEPARPEPEPAPVEAPPETAPAPPMPPPAPAAPTPKKKSSSCLIFVVVGLFVGVVLLAAAGVGGYFVWKKAKAKAQAKLAEVTQMAEQQAQQAQEQSQQEAAPQEQTIGEQVPEAVPEPAPSEPAPSAEPATPPPAATPKPAPKPSPIEAPKHTDPTRDVQADQVNLDNLNKPLIPEPAPAPVAVAQSATLGLILESEAPGTKLVVKVDGAKVYEQDMSAGGTKQRISKELSVSSGAHHIRVAVWRPPQEPVAGEWDFTFDPGSHPVFRIDLGSNWKMEVKRFQ